MDLIINSIFSKYAEDKKKDRAAIELIRILASASGLFGFSDIKVKRIK